MALAKDIFLDRLNNYANALTSSELVSRSLTDILHNEKARMLRNGMAIIGYTILEDFIKKRMGEILQNIGNTSVSFSSLPDKIQEAATINAMKSISNKAQNLKTASLDWLSFVQSETLCISSTNTSSYNLSEFSIGWEKSNVSSDDINAFLSTFKIQGGWSAIADISTAISISLVSPEQIFKNAAQRRHKAAHDASADSPITDLTDYTNQARVIGFAFDSLISKSLHFIQLRNNNYLSGSKKTAFSDLTFRQLIEVGTTWKEYPPNKTKAFRSSSDYLTIFNDAHIRARTAEDILIVKDSSNNIVKWEIPFI